MLSEPIHKILTHLERDRRRIAPTNYRYQNALIKDSIDCLKEYGRCFVFSPEHIKQLKRCFPNLIFNRTGEIYTCYTSHKEQNRRRRNK